jgi:hypothetical protein
MQSLHPKAYGSIVQSAKLAVKFPARCGQGAINYEVQFES